jgi:hypothetical protein
LTTFDPSRGGPESEPATTSADDGALTALFASERRGHPQSPTRQARVWERLESSLPLGPDGGGGGASAPAASTSPASGSTRLLAQLSVAACLVGASMALWSVTSRNEPAPVVGPDPLPQIALPTVATVTAPPPSNTGISVDALPTALLPKPRETVTSSAPAVCTICEERAILEAARSGLREKRYDHALERIGEHANRYHHGQLAEERESLRVHVLVAMGRAEEAERRKVEFEAAFPESPLLASVKRATSR